MASQFVHVLQNDNWAHAARPRDHVHWCSSEPAPVMSAMSPGAHDATFQRPTASSAAAHNLQPPVLPTSAPTEITAPEIFSGAAGLADGDGPRTRSAEKRLAARKGGVEGYSNHPEIQRAESSQLQRQQSQTNEAWKSSSWVSYDKISRQHEFAVEVVSGSAQSCFKFTKIVHIKDKYIIENRTGEVLDVRADFWNVCWLL